MQPATSSIANHWSSRWIFVLAATGSAVGLGNIWKFPYITGENGGGAFVLVYLLCLLLIGLPVMMAEILIGRRSGKNPVQGLALLAKQANGSRYWYWLGGMGVTAGFLILSYYSVFAGQVLAYIIRAFSGTFEGVTAAGATTIYEDLLKDPERMLAWHTIFVVMTVIVVARGIKKGLERAVKFLMPVLFAILLLLVGYATTTGEYFDAGLRFLFEPDFSKISTTTLLEAMGHAFFTLSLGMGAIMAYGAYLPQDGKIARLSFSIAFLDTLVALLAGIAIFPIVFASGLDTDAGPGLIFQALPVAFGGMPHGTFFAGLFFILLTFAAWSSAISLIEPATAWLIERHRLSRRRAAVLIGIVVWLLGLLTIFSFNLLSDWTLLGLTFFGLLDYLTANIMLPLGGLLIALFAGWVMKTSVTQAELPLRSSVLYFIWLSLVRFITPIAIIIIFLDALNILPL